MTVVSTVDELRAELAHLKDQKTRHADTCVGVDQRGYRGPLYFEMQRAYDGLIERLEQRIAKEETQP